MNPQPPLTQPAYDDLHAILTHYEVKEAGLGHRIAHRLRDKLQHGTLDGGDYEPFGYKEGCLFCTVAQECGISVGIGASREAEAWARQSPLGPIEPKSAFPVGFAEGFFIEYIRPGMTPNNSYAADALDACIEDWLVANPPAASPMADDHVVTAQGWTPRDLAALKAQVSP